MLRCLSCVFLLVMKEPEWRSLLTFNKSLSKRHTYQKLLWPCWCVEWCDTVIISCLVSYAHFNCIVQHSRYHNMYKGTMWHCALVSSIPSQSRGLVCRCAFFWCGVSLGAPYTVSLIEFYFFMIFIMIVVTVIGIFMVILYILNYTFRLSLTK